MSKTASQVVFRNVRVIDGSGAAPFAGEVRVEGNRIREIARDGRRLDLGAAEFIDGGGATLMPGMVEAHAHISFCNTPSLEALGDMPPEEHTLATMKHAREMLDQGFTALFSAAAAKARLDVVIRNAIEAGDIPGPRMRAASPELTVTGGPGRRAPASHVPRDLRHLLRRRRRVPQGGARDVPRGRRHAEDQSLGRRVHPLRARAPDGDERAGGGRGRRGRALARQDAWPRTPARPRA